MAEELSVVLSRNEDQGFGFSLLGKPGLPPVISHILDESPAAKSGEVSSSSTFLLAKRVQNMSSEAYHRGGRANCIIFPERIGGVRFWADFVLVFDVSGKPENLTGD